MKLFLIGMMGSGKSYWAKQLATVLQYELVDLDTVIEIENNATISEIFELYGEQFFRNQETKYLRNFDTKNNFVVATGGGTACFNDNMQWMNEQGITIWIDEPIDVLVNRLVKEKAHRPLIKNLNGAELKYFLEQILQQRKPFYSKAKYIISSKEDTTEKLIQLLNLN